MKRINIKVLIIFKFCLDFDVVGVIGVFLVVVYGFDRVSFCCGIL